MLGNIEDLRDFHRRVMLPRMEEAVGDASLMRSHIQNDICICICICIWICIWMEEGFRDASLMRSQNDQDCHMNADDVENKR